MTYEVILSDEALKDLHQWRKSGQKKILVKIAALLEELRQHPAAGTGQVEQLRGNLSGLWSRRIDKGSRMIYRIEEEKVIVYILSLRGHYVDK